MKAALAASTAAAAAALLYWRMRRRRTLRLMQFNILFDLPNPGCIDESVRGYALADELAWPNRCKAIAQRLESSCDVAFLEECGPSMFEDIKALLPDFDGFHASALVEKVVHPDGEEIAMFVRRSTVELLEEPRCRRLVECSIAKANPLRLALIMEKEQPGDSPPEAYAVVSAAVRRRGWGSDQRLVVGGTHLRWEFGSMPAAKGKPVQAICAAHLLLEHAMDVGTSNVALAGDFNSWPTHGAVLALTQGLPPGHAEHPGSDAGDLSLTTPLRSAYAAAHANREPRFTRKKNSLDSQYCLDYVFVGEHVRVAGAGFGAGPPPFAPEGDGSDLPYLPCAAWPSDHLPLVVELGV
jgi:hypothetical protein